MNGLCDAHSEISKNIDHLREGQEALSKLSTKMALDVNNTSNHTKQLFELITQNEDKFKEFKIDFSAKLDTLLAEVRKLKRKPSFAKIVAIVIPSLLGSGGVATLISVLRERGLK